MSFYRTDYYVGQKITFYYYKVFELLNYLIIVTTSSKVLNHHD